MGMPKCFQINEHGHRVIRAAHLISKTRKFSKQLEMLCETENLPRPKIVLGKSNVFGCGFFGCVAPTENPRIVFKITTDSAEAAFVQCLKTLSGTGRFEFPGIANYYGVWSVPAEDCMGRPVFVLWREEAETVGFYDMIKRHCSDHGMRTQQTMLGDFGCLDDEDPETFRRTSNTFRTLNSTLNDLHQTTRAIRDQVWEARARGDDMDEIKRQADQEVFPVLLEVMNKKGLGLLQAYTFLLREMRTEFNGNLPREPLLVLNLAVLQAKYEALADIPWGAGLAECFMSLYSAGLFLADVHSGNIGFVANEAGTPLGPLDIRITDPGLFVPIVTGYDQIKLPVLCADNSRLELFQGLEVPEELPAAPFSKETIGLLHDQRMEIM